MRIILKCIGCHSNWLGFSSDISETIVVFIRVISIIICMLLALLLYVPREVV